MTTRTVSWRPRSENIMARLKVALLLGISYAFVLSKGSNATAPSPAPSLDLFFPPRPQDNTNQSAAGPTTLAPTISERIHASLNNVLRLPIPIWGTVGVPGNGAAPTQSQIQQQQQQQEQTAGGNLGVEHRQQVESIKVGGEDQGAPPASFLPGVSQAIQTIAQLSTLSHWPFGYVTTMKPKQQVVQTTMGTSFMPPTQPSTQQTTTAPPTTTTVPTTQVPVQTPSTLPSTPLPVPPPLPAASPTQPMTPPQFPPSYFLPSISSGSGLSMAPIQSGATQPAASPSLPQRIQNRITSTLNFIRLPSLSEIGRPRPRPMITEPPWVTELLGPTLEPPTTRAPSLGERVQNSIQNVLLFVPATLLNFWYQNWGTQHVDRFIQRLPTPRPGSPGGAVFATISQQGPNPFANFSTGGFVGNSSKDPADLPVIAAFINTNGTLMPTVVHPVFNMTANTIEYQLRGENETTVLWTGSLSNDVFFGFRKTAEEEDVKEIEDDEDEQKIKNVAIQIRKEIQSYI